MCSLLFINKLNTLQNCMYFFFPCPSCAVFLGFPSFSLPPFHLSISHWPTNSGQKWEGPDAVAGGWVWVSMCVWVFGELWRAWTCGKRNQPDDEMSNQPTGFLDLVIWEIEGEKMTAWTGNELFCLLLLLLVLCLKTALDFFFFFTTSHSESFYFNLAPLPYIKKSTISPLNCACKYTECWSCVLESHAITAMKPQSVIRFQVFKNVFIWSIYPVSCSPMLYSFLHFFFSRNCLGSLNTSQKAFIDAMNRHPMW